MNPNPLTIRYGYHAALRHAERQRRRYGRRLDRVAWPNGQASPRRLPLSVVAMAGAGCMPEMVRCLGSFSRYAGHAKRFRIISDGTLTQADGRLLREAGAEVVSLDDGLSPDLPEVIRDQLDRHWMVKKQAVLMSMAGDGPALFVDADIEFFPGAGQLGDDLAALGDRPAYMADVQPALDQRMLRPDDPREPSVNSGFLYFPKPPDWSKALERFRDLPRDAELKTTDQTMAHLALHDANAVPLDPTRYILALDDQFEWRDRYANKPGVVCRHYVGTIRHKMWNRWRFEQ